MHHTYKTQGVCSTQIDFDIEDNKVKNVLLEVQLSGHDCLSKYKNIKKLVIDNTHWDVLPRLLVVGDVSQIDIKGLTIHYLSSKLDENINI